MDCFGLLHMCNQMLLLFTCYSSLCLNGEGSPLNIYLNNNMPWALYKLLYKTDPKHYLKNLIKQVCCLSTVLWASTAFYQGWRSCSSKSQFLLHRTYGPSPQIVPAAPRVTGQSFRNHIVFAPGTQKSCNFQKQAPSLDAEKLLWELPLPSGTHIPRVSLETQQCQPSAGHNCWGAGGSWGCWYFSKVFKL